MQIKYIIDTDTLNDVKKNMDRAMRYDNYFEYKEASEEFDYLMGLKESVDYYDTLKQLSVMISDIIANGFRATMEFNADCDRLNINVYKDYDDEEEEF